MHERDKQRESWEMELMKETLKRGEKLRFRALGSSMFPSIRGGDVITVKPTVPGSSYIGDLLFFENEDQFFVHRLIKKQKINGDLIYIARGDNLPLPDSPFKPSQVMGKVVMLQRGDRNVRFDGALNRYFNRLMVILSPLIYPFSSFTLNNLEFFQGLFLSLNSKFNPIDLFRRLRG